MKKIIFIMSATIFALSMSACNTKKSDSQKVSTTTENASVETGWSGIYTGNLPCADCSGIQTKVELRKDLTYTMETKYVGKSDEIFKTAGEFQWNAQDSTITFDNTLLGQSLVEKNTLVILVNGKKETGDLADNYILRKVDLALVEKYWKLIELFGNPVTAENTPREAHIIFNMDDNRFSGDAGCNRFSGSFQLKDPDRIVFSQAVSTRMMCINGMDTEDKFLQVLNTADSYIIKNDTLILNRARMAPLARFVAVDR